MKQLHAHKKACSYLWWALMNKNLPQSHIIAFCKYSCNLFRLFSRDLKIKALDIAVRKLQGGSEDSLLSLSLLRLLIISHCLHRFEEFMSLRTAPACIFSKIIELLINADPTPLYTQYSIYLSRLQLFRALKPTPNAVTQITTTRPVHRLLKSSLDKKKLGRYANYQKIARRA